MQIDFNVGIPRSWATNNMSSTCPNLLIATDPGEEIDDQVALFFFMLKYASKYGKVHILFTDGLKGSALSAEQRRSLFYEWFFDVIIPSNVTFYVPEELSKLSGTVYGKMLQIAPLTGVPANFFTTVEIQHRYLMGSRADPKSALNMSKSWDDDRVLQGHFEAQERALNKVQTSEISTALARQVPFTSKIIQVLTPLLATKVMDKAFSHFVGRIPSHLPYCMSVTMGANLPTIRNYLKSPKLKKAFDAWYKDRPAEDLTMMIARVDRFTEEASKHAPAMSVSSSEIQKSAFRDALLEIYQVVRFMTDGGDYIDDSFSLKAFFPLGAKDTWVALVRDNNCNLTPAYDLLALYLMEHPEMATMEPSELTSAMEREYASEAAGSHCTTV